MADIFELFKKIEKKNGRQDNSPSFLVAGLGNPGDKYLRTRHNAGFMTLDFIAEKHGFKINRLKFKSLCADTEIEGRRVIFIKPQTFMNNSGEAVREAADFYKIPAENIIIIFDDISLEPGKIRIRKKGSDGGHNGIKSIISCIGSENFQRIKIGVGSKPHPDYDLADWVLGEIPKDTQETFLSAIMNACDALSLMIDGKTDLAMSKFN